jgi:hypothetical protein
MKYHYILQICDSKFYYAYNILDQNNELVTDAKILEELIYIITNNLNIADDYKYCDYAVANTIFDNDNNIILDLSVGEINYLLIDNDNISLIKQHSGYKSMYLNDKHLCDINKYMFYKSKIIFFEELNNDGYFNWYNINNLKLHFNEICGVDNYIISDKNFNINYIPVIMPERKYNILSVKDDSLILDKDV